MGSAPSTENKEEHASTAAENKNEVIYDQKGMQVINLHGETILIYDDSGIAMSGVSDDQLPDGRDAELASLGSLSDISEDDCDDNPEPTRKMVEFMVPEQLEAAGHARPATKVQQRVQKKRGEGGEEDGGTRSAAREGAGGGRTGKNWPPLGRHLRARQQF